MRACGTCGDQRQVMVAMSKAANDSPEWFLCVSCYMDKEKTKEEKLEFTELPPHPSRKPKRKK